VRLAAQKRGLVRRLFGIISGGRGDLGMSKVRHHRPPQRAGARRLADKRRGGYAADSNVAHNKERIAMSLGSIVMSRWLSRAAKACTDRTEPLWKRILRIMLGLLVIATFTLYFVRILGEEPPQ
jgi:hypothetical protein